MKESSGRKQGTASPCAACKLLRRRCAPDCVFAPYFPADEPHKFANVHRVFGASNVNKMLQDLPVEQRGDAVSSMVYEANARVRDPVYGCVGAISSLQQQIDTLQTQLAQAQAEVVYMRMRHFSSITSPSPPCNHHHHHHHHHHDHDQGTTMTTSPESSSPSSSKLMSSPQAAAKSFFSMDIVVDQPNPPPQSLWSY